MDVIFDQDSGVKKLVMHCNNPKMPNFCFYDRCYFELILTKKVPMVDFNVSSISAEGEINLQEESMVSGVATPPRKDDQKIFRNEEGIEIQNDLSLAEDKDKSFEEDRLQ